MRTRRAAGVALFAFFVAMACFGMLSRAIDDASVARVSVVRAAPQALAGATGEMPDEPAAEGEPVAGAGQATISENCSGAAGQSAAQTAYPLCVPLGAVQADGPQRYVFVIEERAGFLGRETVARRVNVTALAADERFVALAGGALSSQQSVVSASTRPLVDGDRIRVLDA